MILSCQNISKSFGTDEILKDISFHIEDYEKAAIVGINGAGKSTLLKIIMGELPPDDGQVVVSKGKSIGYLSQLSNVSSGNTIYDEVMEAKKDIIDIYHRMKALEQEIPQAQGDALEKKLSSYARLTHAWEDANGYAINSEVTGVLIGLGFEESEFTKKVDTLSGGQKTRVCLGRLLLSKPDIILLDEPTNHLDMNSIAWLETFLLNYKGAVLIVAHDRYFLDRIVTKIVEIDHHRGQVFSGNYTAYAQKKAQLREIQWKAWMNQQQEIKHQEAVITKLKSFNREKSIKRAESREKMLAKIERLDKPLNDDNAIHLQLEPSVLSGNDVLMVEGLTKSFGAQHLFKNIDMDIKRSEKVALIGNNGTGKTTILKIINGLLPADDGEIRLGAKVHIGYYDQEHQLLSPGKTIFEEISDAYPTLDNTRIRSVLAAFLFTGDDVFKRIDDLSGGERGRVSLAKLMLSDANFLILDEPTNHLDIMSKEILENAVRCYTGTVLYVSHDRYFINTTATRILDLTGGGIKNYPGNYDNYLEKKDLPTVAGTSGGLDDAANGGSTGNGAAANKSDTTFGNGSGANRGSASPGSGNGAIASAEMSLSDGKSEYQRQKEEAARQRKRQNDLAKTEKRIEEVESRMAELDELLTQEEIYTNVSRLLEINNEKDALDAELLELMERWEQLESME